MLKRRKVRSSGVWTVSKINAKVAKGYQFLVDSREKMKIKSQVKRMGIPHDVTALNSDFVLRRWDKPVEDIVGIERKAVNDLVQSIQTKRIFNQVAKLKRSHKYCFLMITGSLAEHEARMRSMKLKVNRPVIMGTLASLIVRDGINVSWWPSDSILIEMAYRVCVKVSEGKWKQERSMEPKYEMYDPVSMLNMHVPMVSRDRAKKLLKHFGNIANMGQATVSQIAVVPGIGTETATLIHRVLHTGVE